MLSVITAPQLAPPKATPKARRQASLLLLGQLLFGDVQIDLTGLRTVPKNRVRTDAADLRVRPRLPAESHVHYSIYWTIWRGHTPGRSTRISESRWKAMVASVEREVADDIDAASRNSEWWLELRLSMI